MHKPQHTVWVNTVLQHPETTTIQNTERVKPANPNGTTVKNVHALWHQERTAHDHVLVVDITVHRGNNFFISKKEGNQTGGQGGTVGGL